MNKIASIALLLIFFIALGDSEELLDYRLKQHRNLPRAACPQPGRFCSKCNTVAICFADPNEGWTELEVVECATDETCLDGVCTKATNPNCSPAASVDFPCVTPGLFPNPGDCKKYHYCIPRGTNVEELRVDCQIDNLGNHYGYNPRTTYCDKKLTNSVCSGYPVPICQKAGEEAPLRDNPSIYYTCLQYQNVLYPVQQACDNGKIFSVAYRCR